MFHPQRLGESTPARETGEEVVLPTAGKIEKGKR